MSVTTEMRPGRGQVKTAVLDTDVHPTIAPSSPAIQPYLSQRSRDLLELTGIRSPNAELQRIMPGHGALRMDAWTPDEQQPGTDPAFARAQLLDAYDVSAAIINDGAPLLWARGVDGIPVDVSVDLVRAFNDWRCDTWLGDDPRWYTSINVCYEHPVEAVKEIERCRALDPRFVQVLVEQRAESPLGNPRYWPMYEAAASLGLPIGVHVGMHRRMTGTGEPSFYFEDHGDFVLRAFHLISSFIFEGVFDRFPRLQVALVEMGWSWAAPFAWRLDSCWKTMRAEVPHLQRAPSDYLREHFWFGTQPMEEPTNGSWFKPLYEQFEETIGDRLLFASDYPHWDFDSPTESLPPTLPLATRTEIFGSRASELYGIPLKPDSGIEIPTDR